MGNHKVWYKKETYDIFFNKNQFPEKDVKRYLGAASLNSLGGVKIPKKCFKPVVECILNRTSIFDNYITHKISAREHKQLFKNQEESEAFLILATEELILKMSENWLKFGLKVPHYTRMMEIKDSVIIKLQESCDHSEDYRLLMNKMLEVLEGTFNCWVECELEYSVIGYNAFTYQLLTEQFIKLCYKEMHDRIEKYGMEEFKQYLSQRLREKRIDDVSYW